MEFVSRARAISVYGYRLQVWCTLIAFCILAFSGGANSISSRRSPGPGRREARASADRLKTQFTGAKHTTTLAHDKRADEDRDVRIPNDVDAC